MSVASAGARGERALQSQNVRVAGWTNDVPLAHDPGVPNDFEKIRWTSETSAWLEEEAI